MVNLLAKQLEESKFKHAIEYVRQNATGLKKLNSTELAFINSILINGKSTTSNAELWRTESIELQIPTGKVHSFNVISNPVVQTRDILSRAHEYVIDGNYTEAATYVYTQLILGHFFKEANRRTAVAAAVHVLAECGQDIDADVLLKNKVGDLREPGEIERIKKIIEENIK